MPANPIPSNCHTSNPIIHLFGRRRLCFRHHRRQLLLISADIATFLLLLLIRGPILL
jgi:hypothetical protein